MVYGLFIKWASMIPASIFPVYFLLTFDFWYSELGQKRGVEPSSSILICSGSCPSSLVIDLGSLEESISLKQRREKKASSWQVVCVHPTKAPAWVFWLVFCDVILDIDLIVGLRHFTSWFISFLMKNKY